MVVNNVNNLDYNIQNLVSIVCHPNIHNKCLCFNKIKLYIHYILYKKKKKYNSCFLVKYNYRYNNYKFHHNKLMHHIPHLIHINHQLNIFYINYN